MASMSVTSASTTTTSESASARSTGAGSGNHSFLPAWMVPKSQALLVIERTSQRKSSACACDASSTKHPHRNAGIRRLSSIGIRGPGGLGFLEGGHGDRLIPDLEDLELLVAPGRMQAHHVALAALDERARDGRDPAHVVPCGVGLVDAHDLHRRFLALRVGVGHGRAEEHLVGLL